MFGCGEGNVLEPWGPVSGLSFLAVRRLPWRLASSGWGLRSSQPGGVWMRRSQRFGAFCGPVSGLSFLAVRRPPYLDVRAVYYLVAHLLIVINS